MYLMLQQDQPDDFVVATGETNSVRNFCEAAFGELGLNYQDHVVIDESFYRPAEVDLLVGDASKAQQLLDWRPQRAFKELVAEMVAADLRAYQSADQPTFGAAGTRV